MQDVMTCSRAVRKSIPAGPLQATPNPQRPDSRVSLSKDPFLNPVSFLKIVLKFLTEAQKHNLELRCFFTVAGLGFPRRPS